MATDRGHDRGDYPRVCDVCGHRFMFSALTPIGELRFACAEDAQGLTANQISKFNARVKPIIVRPRKWAKDYVQTPIYQFSEAAIFNFIAEVAPAGERDGATHALSAAWAAIYMADIVIQEKRPMNWDRTARDVIERCLAVLLPLQLTEGGKAWRGGLTTDDLSTDTTLTVAAGVAFVKAYLVTDEPSYLAAAEEAATHVRSVQCSDLRDVAPVTYPGSSAPYRPGGLATAVAIDDDGALTGHYYLRDVYALVLLDALRDIRGEDYQYGSTLTSGFSASPVASIATMIEELAAFATDGVLVSGSSVLVSGLSTTAPRVQYNASQGGGSAEWVTDDDGYPVRDFALSLAGLNAAASPIASAATAFMAFLASLSSVDGDFDPALCPPTVIDTFDAGFSEGEASLYDWASLGLLSPILSQTPATFKTSKDALSTARRFNSVDVTAKFVGVDGLSTFEPRPITPATSGTYDTSVVRAARAGLAYRQDPGRYPALRGN